MAWPSRSKGLVSQLRDFNRVLQEIEIAPFSTFMMTTAPRQQCIKYTSIHEGVTSVKISLGKCVGSMLLTAVALGATARGEEALPAGTAPWMPEILAGELADRPYLPDFSYAGYRWGE